MSAKMGDMVKIQYTAKANNEVVYTTPEPVLLKIGNKEVIEAFEKALIGMKEGENKVIALTAEQAFGPYLKELIMNVERAKLPPDIHFEVGKILQIQQEDGFPLLVTIKDANETSVTFDANHPLAGKDLVFEIQLINIVS
jgi:peptidylprolyl isomerase